MNLIGLMSSSRNKKPSDLITGFRHFSDISLKVATTTIGTMALLGVPAYFLDKKLETWPWFFVGALIVALPLSQYLVYLVMKEYSQDNSSK